MRARRRRRIEIGIDDMPHTLSAGEYRPDETIVKAVKDEEFTLSPAVLKRVVCYGFQSSVLPEGAVEG
jgi:hypothetical protein